MNSDDWVVRHKDVLLVNSFDKEKKRKGKKKGIQIDAKPSVNDRRGRMKAKKKKKKRGRGPKRRGVLNDILFILLVNESSLDDWVFIIKVYLVLYDNKDLLMIVLLPFLSPPFFSLFILLSINTCFHLNRSNLTKID